MAGSPTLARALCETTHTGKIHVLYAGLSHRSAGMSIMILATGDTPQGHTRDRKAKDITHVIDTGQWKKGKGGPAATRLKKLTYN
jgi:hypothetical protein